MSERELTSPSLDLVFDGLDTFAAIDLVNNSHFHEVSTQTNLSHTRQNGRKLLECVIVFFDLDPGLYPDLDIARKINLCPTERL